MQFAAMLSPLLLSSLFVPTLFVQASNVVIVGKIGAGKSTLFNSLVQEDVSPVGIGHIGTTELIARDFVVGSETVTLWDTPGFFDGHTSAIRILRRIESAVSPPSAISKFLLVLPTPQLGAPGRQGPFPDLDVVEFFFAAVGEAVWTRRVSLVFSFAQWQSPAALEGVRGFINGELGRKGIPEPWTICFAGDEVDGLPGDWHAHLLSQIGGQIGDQIGSQIGSAPFGHFLFGTMDAGLLGTDETAIQDLHAEKSRLDAEERESIQRHRAAAEAARLQQEELERRRLQAEKDRQELARRAADERIQAQRQADALAKKHAEALEQARFNMRVEEAKARLAQEDLNDVQRKAAGLMPEVFMDISYLRSFRRMTLAEQTAYVHALPALANQFYHGHGLMARWRVPEDLRPFVL